MSVLAKGLRIARDPAASLRRASRRAALQHRLPVGVVAQERRLLAAGLPSRVPGRVLVLGPAVALRQAHPTLPLDVVGTSAHDVAVTVVTEARGTGALPPARWDRIVLTDPPLDEIGAVLDAVVPACRVGGHVVVLGPRSASLTEPLAERARIVHTARTRLRHLVVAEVGP